MASHSARWFCGQKFVELGLGLLAFVLLSDNGGVVFKQVTPSGNCNRLGMVQKTMQDGTGSGHVTKNFAPFLQWPAVVHHGGPVYMPAHDQLKTSATLFGNSGQRRDLVSLPLPPKN